MAVSNIFKCVQVLEIRFSPVKASLNGVIPGKSLVGFQFLRVGSSGRASFQAVVAV